MSSMLLAVPVLLPIIGGGAILLLGQERKGTYRQLELLVEGLVLFNSFLIAWLILPARKWNNVWCSLSFTVI